MNNNKKKGYVAFILGCVAVAFSILEMNIVLIIIGCLLGIASLIAGLIYHFKEKNIFSNAGIILGICAILISIMWTYLYIIAR